MVEQVGGKHYFTGDNVVQHWDVVPGQAAYLLGCASKYASRHRSKLGRQDVEKAVSYLEKIVETVVNYQPEVDTNLMFKWAMSVPKMTVLDWHAIQQMYAGDFHEAIDTLRLILKQDYPVDQRVHVHVIRRGDPTIEGTEADISTLQPIPYEYRPEEHGMPVMTNTPRPGESIEATRMRVERRVPRFNTETEVIHRVGDISKTEILREQIRKQHPKFLAVNIEKLSDNLGKYADGTYSIPDNEEGRRIVAALRERFAAINTAPWVVGHSYVEDLKIRRDTVPPHVFDLFFCRWAPDTYKLEPHVESLVLPKELAGCYHLEKFEMTKGAWVINIEKVPQEVREMFIDLPREVNGLQHMGLPEWQRSLYREEQTKWTLINEAWHRG